MCPWCEVVQIGCDLGNPGRQGVCVYLRGQGRGSGLMDGPGVRSQAWDSEQGEQGKELQDRVVWDVGDASGSMQRGTRMSPQACSRPSRFGASRAGV